jgi:TetR/AcrR family transcriptional regulator, repressor of fatR-cypB operon
MNDCSFKIQFMARNIDESKLKRIKEATIEMVVQNGFGGASISEIAKKANVAVGYLYMYYKSKNDLVSDLLFENVNKVADKLELLLEQNTSVDELISNLVRNIFETAIAQPLSMKFMYVLLHDYNFALQETQRERIASLCTRLKNAGIANGGFRPYITEEEIYLIGVVYPIQFINLRFKTFFGKSEIGEVEIMEVIKICLNSLKG